MVLAENRVRGPERGDGATVGGDHRVPRHVPRLVVAGGDVCVVLAGFFLAFLMRFGGDVPASGREAFLDLAPWLAGGTLLALAGLGLYERRLNGFLPTLRALFTGVILVGLATAAASYWFREFAFPRSIILIGGCIQLALLVGWRWLMWRADCRLHGQRRLLIVGDDGDVLTFFGKLWGMPGGASLWGNGTGAGVGVPGGDRVAVPVFEMPEN